MRSWLRGAVFGALVLAVVPLQGCTLGYLTIAIPDFVSKAVTGVWLWRLSPLTGLYERDVRLAFTPPTQQPDGEKLDYQAAPSDGSPPMQLTTYFVRDPANPDRVTLRLLFSRIDQPTRYRASTYNGNGDSPLSSEMLPM